MSAAQVRAYECNVRGRDWQQVIHSTSAGKARSEYLRGVREAWPDVRFVDIVAHSLGKPRTSEEFLRVAKYRGVPFARIGMRVEVGDKPGVIVGSNQSANFDVLFTGGACAGQTLNCHPLSQVRYFDDDGKEIDIATGKAAA